MKRLFCLYAILLACLPAMGQVAEDSVRQVMEQEDVSFESVFSEADADTAAVGIMRSNVPPVMASETWESALLNPLIRTALLGAWRRIYPFKSLSKEQLNAARADTLLDKSQRPYQYSKAKQSADSIKAIVRMRSFDKVLMYGQVDYRMPLMVTGEVASDTAMTLLAEIRRINRDRAIMNQQLPRYDRYFTRQIEFGIERYQEIYKLTSRCPRRAVFVRRKFDLPGIDRTKLSAESGLENSHIVVEDGASVKAQVTTVKKIKADVWHRKASVSLQMQQTALSDNWYKGGDNNMSITSDQRFSISRYDELKKTTFDVVLQMKLSGYYTKADTVHSMRVSDNTFSADVKYGYKAWKKLYYSASVYAKTPIFDYYNTNSRVVKSTFLSPLELNVGLGVDFKNTTKSKKVSYSLLLAPLSYNLKYVNDHRVNETSYGIDQGKRALNQFGSTLTAKLEWKVNDNLLWSSRFYYFTSYQSVLLEFENTFSFAISSRFNAKFYLYPRFDDSADDELQIKEMLTFGFNYRW